MNTRASTVTSPLGWLSLIVLSAMILLPLRAHAGWRQTFADEFSASAVDRAKWQTKDGFGTQTYSGGGVQEAQCYEDAATATANGNLVITATRKTFTQCAAAIDLKAIQYSSGRITSYGKFSQTYGYFEARMKIPAGAGFWPAFWLLPTDNSWPPEIDIMEWVGKDPYQTHHTFHWYAGGHTAKGTGVRSAVPWSQDWHTYGVDWQPGLLIWYVDGKEVARVANGYVPNKPMYVLVNLALGGSWGGWVDNNAIPNQMLVDYVRAYARVNDGKSDVLPPFANVPPVVKLPPSLLMSSAPDRSAPVALQGAAPTDDIYVFAKTDSTARRVEFWLDDATPTNPSGAPRQIENAAPYDFAGTAVDDNAQPLDIAALSSGRHTVSVRVTLQDGTVQPVVTASFTIDRTNLYVSSAPDRSNPRRLQDYAAPANTSLYVFAGPEADLARVTFWLDDSTPTNPSGAPRQIENLGPFDLAGSAADSSAQPLDIAALSSGPHTVSVRVTLQDGTVQPVVTASFTINKTDLYVSSAPDRSNPRRLQGYAAPANTSLYVFAGPEADLARVTFWLDDPTPTNPSGVPVKIENMGPFDLAGTGSNASALPFNTSAVARGTHQLTIRATKTDGSTAPPVSASFTRW